MHPRKQAAIWLLTLILVPLAAPVAWSSDLPRFPLGVAPAAGTTTAQTDAAQIAELKELLRQAQELQKSQQKALEKAGTKGEDGAAPAKADADPTAKGNEGEEAEKEAEPKPVVRAGCMYRGKTLIWEKVPGTCK